MYLVDELAYACRSGWTSILTKKSTLEAKSDVRTLSEIRDTCSFIDGHHVPRLRIRRTKNKNGIFVSACLGITCLAAEKCRVIGLSLGQFVARVSVARL